MWVFAVLYVLQVVYSFVVMCRSWLFDSDLDLGDAIFFGIISLIPIAFVFSTIEYVTRYPYQTKHKGPIVIIKRRGNGSTY